MIEHGRPFVLSLAWDILEQYFHSLEYWSDALQLLYLMKTARFEIATHSFRQYKYFSSLQLKLFANRLTANCLLHDEEIDLIFLWQAYDNKPEHFLQRYDRPKPDSTPAHVFLHAARTRYEPLVSSSLDRKLSNPGRVFETRYQSTRPPAPFYLKNNPWFPKGQKLRWVMGMIDRHSSGQRSPF